MRTECGKGWHGDLSERGGQLPCRCTKLLRRRETVRGRLRVCGVAEGEVVALVMLEFVRVVVVEQAVVVIPVRQGRGL